MKNMTKEFFEYVERMIDNEGVYPYPGFALMQDGKVEIAALATDPHGVYRWFWDKVSLEGAVECMVGLDRTTQEGQGTEFGDVLTCWYWREGLDDQPWNKSFRVAVINYQNEPRIVRPIDWDNEYWNGQIPVELSMFAPAFRINVVKDQSNAKV